MRWLNLLILFIALGLVGAFPALILAYFFSAGQAAIAWEVYFLGAILLGSWLPLKALIDSRVKGQSLDNILPKNVSSLAISFALVAFIFLIPFLYLNTALTFLSAIVFNALFNFPAALMLSLLIQGILLYRLAQREKTLGTSSQIFMQFNNMGYSETIIMNTERQSPRPYESEMLILPSQFEILGDAEDDYDEDSSENTQSDSLNE